MAGGSGTFVQKVTVEGEGPCASRHCGDANGSPHNWFGEFLEREMQHTTKIDVPCSDRAGGGNVIQPNFGTAMAGEVDQFLNLVSVPYASGRATLRGCG